MPNAEQREAVQFQQAQRWRIVRSIERAWDRIGHDTRTHLAHVEAVGEGDVIHGFFRLERDGATDSLPRFLARSDILDLADAIRRTRRSYPITQANAESSQGG
jgi:hypothetical protein